jgi:hypothetical protein
VFLNEFMSGFRHPHAVTALLGEMATADVLIGEQISGNAIIFEH